MEENEILRDKEYYIFLEDLRRSGLINMYGATPYLQEAFGLDREESTKYLVKFLKYAEQIQQVLYRDTIRSRGEKREIMSQVLDNEDVLQMLYDNHNTSNAWWFSTSLIGDYDEEKTVEEARNILKLFIKGFDYIEFGHQKDMENDDIFSLEDDGEDEDFIL